MLFLVHGESGIIEITTNLIQRNAKPSVNRVAAVANGNLRSLLRAGNQRFR